MRRVGPAARTALALTLLLWFLLPLLPLLVWAGADPAAFSTAWNDGAGAALTRSLVLAGTVAGIATPLGASAARALTLRQASLPRLTSALLLAPLAIPAFAVVMGLNVLLLRLHVPAPAGILLVLVVAALPYTTYVMRVAYGAYDVTYEDEARTLGASPRTVAWRVRLPLVAPALASAAFLAFLVGWSDYIVTLVVGGGRFVTVPIQVGSAAAGSGNEPAIAALSLAALVPPIAALAAGRALASTRRAT